MSAVPSSSTVIVSSAQHTDTKQQKINADQMSWHIRIVVGLQARELAVLSTDMSTDEAVSAYSAVATDTQSYPAPVAGGWTGWLAGWLAVAACAAWSPGPAGLLYELVRSYGV